MSQSPFSLKELDDAGPGGLTPTLSLEASDGVTLAYRPYLPEKSIAALVFYHGGGAHSGAGYAHLATGLRDSSGVAVYTPDIRGHGESGGARGDSPCTEQLYRDYDAFVRLAREAHPGVPVFIGGHSSGAGLTLNFSSWESRSPVDGFVFLSPHLGFRARADRAESGRTPFANVSIAPFILHAISGGYLMGNWRAVRFNYPPETLAKNPKLVTSNTVNVANAVTPEDPARQFAAIDKPFGLWIGADDELFEPDKVIAFGDGPKQTNPGSEVGVVPNQNHLGILVSAHSFIAPWLSSCAGDWCPSAREQKDETLN